MQELGAETGTVAGADAGAGAETGTVAGADAGAGAGTGTVAGTDAGAGPGEVAVRRPGAGADAGAGADLSAYLKRQSWYMSMSTFAKGYRKKRENLVWLDRSKQQQKWIIFPFPATTAADKV